MDACARWRGCCTHVEAKEQATGGSGSDEEPDEGCSTILALGADD